MIISQTAGIPIPCVSVSTAGTPVSKSETHLTDTDPISLNERTYEVSDAINCLIDAGYKLGCDGELLPPKWAYEAFKGADA
jgi:hypothetical protein